MYKYLIDVSGTSFRLYKLEDDVYHLITQVSFRDLRDYFTERKKTLAFIFENIFETSFAELEGKKPFLVKYKTPILWAIPDEYGDFLVMVKKFLLALVDREAYRQYAKHEGLPDMSEVKFTDALRLLDKQEFFSLVKEQNFDEAADALKRIMSVEEI